MFSTLSTTASQSPGVSGTAPPGEKAPPGETPEAGGTAPPGETPHRHGDEAFHGLVDFLCSPCGL